MQYQLEKTDTYHRSLYNQTEPFGQSTKNTSTSKTHYNSKLYNQHKAKSMATRTSKTHTQHKPWWPHKSNTSTKGLSKVKQYKNKTYVGSRLDDAHQIGRPHHFNLGWRTESLIDYRGHPYKVMPKNVQPPSVGVPSMSYDKNDTWHY